MTYKTLLATAALAATMTGFAANTWYVDDDWYEKGGTGTADAPFGTIQQAVNAAAACDTILVLPGTYDKGVTDGFRVKIPNGTARTNLTIRATGGRDVTFIVGQRHSDEVPNGSNAIGGINCGPWQGVTIVDGFTFRDCHRASDTTVDAGALFGSWDHQDALQVFNSAVVACSGRPVYGAVLHSSLVTENFAAPRSPQVLFGRCIVDNCLVTKNTGGALCVNVKLVNCTLAGNTASLLGDGCDGFHNSICAMSPNLSSYAVPIVNSVSSGALSLAQASNVTNNVPAVEIFAGLGSFSDFRLRADSPAVGRATLTVLEEHVPLPSADRDPADEPGRYSTYHDAYGQPIDRTAEHINAGAVQEAVAIDDAAVGLASFVHGYKEPLVIDGEVFPGAEAFIRLSSTCPTQWCVTAASPEEHPLSAVEDSLAGHSWLSGRNGSIWVTRAPVGQVRTLTVKTAQKIFYMDPNGNDAWDGLSATWDGGTSGPWQTFTNAAMRLVKDTSNMRLMVRCAPGVYDKGERDHRRAWFDANNNLYWNKHEFHFVGVEGAEKTFLVGADATSADRDANGCGENAVGCIHNCGAVIGFTGFTFTGGRTEAMPASRGVRPAFLKEYSGNGTQNASANFCESIISNNVSTADYLSYSAHFPVFERCLIVDNGSSGCYAFLQARLFGCISANNQSASGWPFYRYDIVAVNTTFVREQSTSAILWSESTHHAYNCIFTDYNGTGYMMLPDAVGCVYDKSEFNDRTDPSKNTKAVSAMYVDKKGRDFRVFSCSPANGAARMDGADYIRYAAADFEGNPVCRGAAPTVSGAYASTVASGVYVDDPKNHLQVDGGKADGGHLLTPGASLTISANPTGSTRPISGVVLNGVTNLFTGASGTVTVTAEQVAETSVAVTPVVGNTWYVNAGDDPNWATGSDDNLGWGTWSPLKTLKKAMSKVQLDDVVIAAPGSYAEEVMPFTVESVSTYARVVVPERVTLRSEQGPEKTFIVGQAATTPDADEYGRGADAVGCVVLQNNTSSIQGFTLTGGRGHLENRIRGAALKAAENSLCSDCVISNCVAYRTILFGGRYHRCRVVGNLSTGNPFLYGARLTNVYCDDNRFLESGDGYCYASSAWTNVTWGAHNLTTEGNRPNWGISPHGIDAVNCIVFGKLKNNATDATATNCLITDGVFKNADEAEILLDDRGCPLVVDGNPALDAGLMPDDAAALEKDAAGNVRVMNGTIDIGAFEADWRPRYAKDIGRGVTVTAVTPAVVETARRTVSFGEGGTVTFDWNCVAPQTCELALNVTGNGALTVTREGTEPVVYTVGEHVYAFKETSSGVERFTLTYAPGEEEPGTAEILKARSKGGLVVVFR